MNPELVEIKRLWLSRVRAARNETELVALLLELLDAFLCSVCDHRGLCRGEPEELLAP